MTRKTTKFSRKRQASGGVFHGGAFLDAIQRCKPYSEEPIIGSWLPGTYDTAERAIKLVRGAFDSLKAGTTPPDTEKDFDLVSHGLGVACIRAGQIAGTAPEDNLMLPPLIAGNVALRAVLARRRKWGKWELISADVYALDWAIEIYETIVRASSPAQMSDAVDLRREALKGQFLEALDAA
jgi:hypothetical protein